MPQISMHAPMFDLTIFEEAGKIVSVDWGWGYSEDTPTPLLQEAKAQLDAYFDGDLKEFDLPLDPSGSNFQMRLWKEIEAIPYGETVTYQFLAKKLSSSARAVGNGCGRNPIPIVIPCHRITGQNTLGGYSGEGGADTKKILLTLEEALQPTLF